MNGIVFVIKSDFNRLNIGFIVVRCDRVNSICVIQGYDDDPHTLKIGQFNDSELPNCESTIIIDENVLLNQDGLFRFSDDRVSLFGRSYRQTRISNIISFCRIVLIDDGYQDQGWLILDENLRLSYTSGSTSIVIRTPVMLSELLNIDNQVYLTNDWKNFYHFDGEKIVLVE